MNRKIFSVVLLLLVVFSLPAAEWWEGRRITGFSTTDLKNVSSMDINNALYEYRNKELTEDLVSEMEGKLERVDGVASVSTGAYETESNDVRVLFQITEYPLITAVNIQGQSKVRRSDILSALTLIKAGSFIDPSRTSVIESSKAEIEALYFAKGFDSIPIDIDYIIDQETSTVAFDIKILEGVQTRIVSLGFEGNEHATASVLKKHISSKVRSLFNQGYLSSSKILADEVSIVSYYQTIGYVDATVVETRIEEVESENARFREVSVVFVIDEGRLWYYGGMDVSGNSIYSDEELGSVMTLSEGSVLNLDLVVTQYNNVADIYFNNGYISNRMAIEEERNEEDSSIRFHILVTEGPQAVIERIVISGLGKTKEYVMRRELALSEGDIFSKSKLQTSMQNLYNTGLLEKLDYDIYYGNGENSVVLEFILTEGHQMDIQFGATFGGSVSGGFPVSGFLQWSDRNLGGRGQTLSVSTTLSPDSQKASVSFSNGWVGDKRWSNTFSLSFGHSKYSNELQKGTGSGQYSGWNDGSVWPLGYNSYADWKNSGLTTPAKQYLMSYRLYNVTLGWTTGYTFIFDAGRLSLSTGLNIGVNHATFDERYIPYERLISRYAEEGLKFSNKINLGVQWDGRDYVTNTTKGYVLGVSATYAGGFMGGLSNYIRTGASAAGYLKLFEVGREGSRKNIMLCASTNVNFMLPQFYNNTEDESNPGFGFHDAKLGATKYEMLYIDGMTIARGHSILTGQAFLWDNMLEISYPLAENILQLEAFVSATAVSPSLDTITRADWYYSAGAGVRLKISGFPLGLYLVKNAAYKGTGEAALSKSFSWLDGSILGMNLVLAISTSLI